MSDFGNHVEIEVAQKKRREKEAFIECWKGTLFEFLIFPRLLREIEELNFLIKRLEEADIPNYKFPERKH